MNIAQYDFGDFLVKDDNVKVVAIYVSEVDFFPSNISLLFVTFRLQM